VQPLRRGPPTGAPGNQGNGGTLQKNQVRITSERREALYDAGVIDGSGNITNRPKFNKIAAEYAAQDRANGAGR
jgi:hypothetical protein